MMVVQLVTECHARDFYWVWQSQQKEHGPSSGNETYWGQTENHVTKIWQLGGKVLYFNFKWQLCNSLGDICKENWRKKIWMWELLLQGDGGGQNEVEAVQWPDYLWPHVGNPHWRLCAHFKMIIFSSQGYENEICSVRKERDQAVNSRITELKDKSIQVNRAY